MVGGGDWGAEGSQGPMRLALQPSRPGWAATPRLDEPLLTALESPGHTLRWCLHEAHGRLPKECRWAWENERTGVGEGGGQEILVSCLNSGTFGVGEDCDGRRGGGAHWRMRARLCSSFGVRSVKPRHRQQGRLWGGSDGDAREGGEGIKCRAKGSEDGRGRQGDIGNRDYPPAG